LLDRRSLRILGGATRSSKAVGPIARIDCSKRSVKSKSERHPWTTGPKTLSWHDEAILGRGNFSAQLSQKLRVCACLKQWLQYANISKHSQRCKISNRNTQKDVTICCAFRNLQSTKRDVDVDVGWEGRVKVTR
jgi:hypothetical protein